MRAPARMAGMLSLEYCGSPFLVGLLGMRMLTTPSACGMIPRCAGLWAARQFRIARHRRAKLGRFETQWLAADKNLLALADLSGQWIDRVHARRPPRGIVLDMDSSGSPAHGGQELSVCDGHHSRPCSHPLV